MNISSLLGKGNASLARCTLGFALGCLWGVLLFAETLRGGFRIGRGTAKLQEAVFQHYLGSVIWANVWFALGIVLSAAILGLMTALALLLLAAAMRKPQPPRRRTVCIMVPLVISLYVGGRFLYLFSVDPGSVVAAWTYDLGRLRWLAPLVHERAITSLHEWVPLLLLFTLSCFSVLAMRQPRSLWLHSLVPWVCPVLLVAYPGVCCWSWVAHRSAFPDGNAGTKPNVLVLAVDSLRADRLGCYGYDQSDLTPAIDDLAGRSIVLKNCFVPIARTRPSLVSMFTGLYPHHHGARDDWGIGDLHAGVDNYVRVFSRGGYFTSVVGDWAATDFLKNGFEFDQVDVPEDSWNLRTLIKRGSPMTALMLNVMLPDSAFSRLFRQASFYIGRDTTTALLKTLEEHVSRAQQLGKPFFIVHFGSTTHAPVSPRGCWLRKLCSERLDDADAWVYSFGARNVDEAVRIVSDPGNDVRKRLVHASYDAAVRTFDEHVRSVLAMLARKGATSNTIVVVLSDHGISLFDYQSYGQGNWIGHDVENRIPCIIHDPRRKTALNIETPVSSVSIFPSLARLAGLREDWSVDGEDLTPVFAGSERREDDFEPAVFMETGIWIGHPAWIRTARQRLPDITEMCFVPSWDDGTIVVRPEYARTSLAQRYRAVRTRRFRLVALPGDDGLLEFDLWDSRGSSSQNDWTQVPSARSHPAFEALRSRLFAWLRSDPCVRVDGDRLRWDVGPKP